MRIASSLIVLALTFASCNKCKDVECVNGGCADGECLCSQGYTGDLCDTEKTPYTLTLHRVEFSFGPDYLGGVWDDEGGEAPDLFLGVREGTGVDFSQISTNLLENHSGKYVDMQVEPAMTFSSPEELVRFSLNDLDSEDFNGTFFYEEVYWFTIFLYERGEGFPTEWTHEYEGGTKVTFHMTYAFR